jgi:hypothetical protein
MKIEFVYQPKKIPLKCKHEFDMIIRFTQYTKWPKLNKFLLSLGFLWEEIILLDHFKEPMSLWFKHKLCNKLIITTV